MSTRDRPSAGSCRDRGKERSTSTALTPHRAAQRKLRWCRFSFTFNLVQYFGALGETPVVYRNDALSVDDVGALAPEAIVISPGPGVQSDAGITIPLIRRWGATVPILGVCLGHQAIGEAYGGRVVRAKQVMHGKTSDVRHDGTGLFAGLPDPLRVMRYHSLVIEPGSLPDALEVVARADDDPSEIHAVKHREHPVWGVQFHPESVMTEGGMEVLGNWLGLGRGWGGGGSRVAGS